MPKRVRIYTKCLCCKTPYESPGPSSYCPECRSEKYQKWYEENREWKLQKSRDFRKANPEKVSQANSRYNEAHAEDRRAYSRRWAKENPEKDRANTARRRARKKSVEVGVVDYAAIVERQQSLCATCNTFVPDGVGLRHFDHWIPLKHGGAHSTENHKMLCSRCNTSKGAKMPEEFKPKPPTKKTRPGQPHLLNPDWTAKGRQ